MPTTERRSNWRRRYRCRVMFGWLNRSERWISIFAKIMKGIAMIAAAASLIAFILHQFGQTPSWLIELLAKK